MNAERWNPAKAGMRHNVTMKVCALFVCLGAALVPAVANAADVLTIEQIVAKVNGDIITRSDLDRAKREMAAGMKSQGVKQDQIEAALQQAEKDGLRDKIDNMLLIQRGKELDLKVDPEVTKYMNDIMKKQGIADPDKFQSFIREQTGMSYEDFKNEVKNSILSQRVIGQELYSKVNVPKEKIQEFYEANKTKFVRQERVFLREIFVSTVGKDEVAQAAAEKKAKDIVARARRGERFTDLARDNSESGTAQQGGMLPDGFAKGDLIAEMEKAVWEQAKGFVSDPVKIPNGWVILRVEDHQKEGQAELADVEGEIRERLGSEMMGPKYRQYMTELRLNAYLEIREGFVDSGAAPGKNTNWADPAILQAATISKVEVENQRRMRHLLFVFPVPGTSMANTGKSSSK